MSLLYPSGTPRPIILPCTNESVIVSYPEWSECVSCTPNGTSPGATNSSQPSGAHHSAPDDDLDPRLETLRRYSYGIALPSICLLGIIGNILNLIVLTRRNMRGGPAYVYMRGYSAAALLAILLALPFAWRVLIHREEGHWEQQMSAIYFAHFELFLGNACLGIGVLMLVALTLERYFSVCHPGRYVRPILGAPARIVICITIGTFCLYLPMAFRSHVTSCHLRQTRQPIIIYQRHESSAFVTHPAFQIYKFLLEIMYKIVPIAILAALNLRILIVYRQTCRKRRRMTSEATSSDPRKQAEERRLIFLLGSTSVLFLVCITPMVILNVTLSQYNLTKYSYQVFRAVANLLEVTNYSITFYIYCLFSEDFRKTLLTIFTQLIAMGGAKPTPSSNHRGGGAGQGTPPPTATTVISCHPHHQRSKNYPI